jgi:uncharacterized damage-inducible protein DinB
MPAVLDCLMDFRRLFDYDTWANAKALDSVHTVAAPSDQLLGLVAHVFASKRMWLGRIEESDDANMNTWPQLTLEESEAWEAELRARWQTLVAELDADGLARTVTYTTAAGDPGRQTVADILTHKFLHAMYHRGQLAMAVRAEGGSPASTDFVVWTKTMRETGVG